MLVTALLLSTLAVQQPAAAPAKPQGKAAQQADTAKAKAHRTRHARKAKPATATAPAQRDTTKHP